MALHKVGRPPRSEYATTTLSVRLTDLERATLMEHSAALAKPAAVLIREAMEAAGLFVLPKPRKR